MLAILNSLNAPNFPIFQPILMIIVSKFMIHRALSDKRYLSLGLLSPLNNIPVCFKNSMKPDINSIENRVDPDLQFSTQHMSS